LHIRLDHYGFVFHRLNLEFISAAHNGVFHPCRQFNLSRQFRYLGNYKESKPRMDCRWEDCRTMKPTGSFNTNAKRYTEDDFSLTALRQRKTGRPLISQPPERPFDPSPLNRSPNCGRVTPHSAGPARNVPCLS
jgi:hypothetical protein